MFGGELANFARKFARVGKMYAVFTIMFFLYFAPGVFNGRLLAPADDYTQSLPAFLGERTLWTTMLWSGWPLHADPLAQIWYPLSILMSALPLPLGWNLFNISGYSLCSVMMFFYVREITGKNFPAFVAAAIFPLSGSMIAEVRQCHVVHSLFYLFAILISMEKLAKSRSTTWLCVGIVCLTFCILNGQMQNVAYILGVVVAYAVFRLFTMEGGQGKFSMNVACMILIGLMLGGIQILPTLELASFTTRGQFAFVDFLSYCHHPLQAVGLITPLIFGAYKSTYQGLPYFGLDLRPPHALYFGILPLITLAGSLLLARRSPQILFWLVIGLLAFFLAFGNATPLAWLFYHIPPFGSFRALSRLYLIAVAAFAIICGLVLSDLSEHKLSRRRLIVFSASFVCLAWGGILVSLQLLQSVLGLPDRASIDAALPPFWQNPALVVPLVTIALTLTIFLVWVRFPKSQYAMVALFVIATGDVAYVSWFSEWRTTRITMSDLAMPPHLKPLRDQLAITHQRLFPVRGVSSLTGECPPNTSKLWQIPSASGFNPLVNKRYADLLGVTEGGFLPEPWSFTSGFQGFDVLAIKYLLVPSGDTRLVSYNYDGRAVFRKIAQYPDVDVFENVRAQPRAWMVGEKIVLNDGDVLQTLKTGLLPNGHLFKPNSAVLSSEGVNTLSPNFSGIANIVKIADTSIEVETNSNSDGYLVLSDIAYPGWLAKIDGVETNIILSDYVLRGLPVPAGRHNIQLEYRPIALLSGIGVSILGSILLAAVVIRRLRIKRKVA